MNFTPVDTNLGGDAWIDTRCNRPEGPDISCPAWGSRDPTPFLQELITVDNIDYYHVIVGLPEDGFSQETFIKGESKSASIAAASIKPEAGSKKQKTPHFEVCRQ